jgi:hypothetical protein
MSGGKRQRGLGLAAIGNLGTSGKIDEAPDPRMTQNTEGQRVPAAKTLASQHRAIAIDERLRRHEIDDCGDVPGIGKADRFLIASIEVLPAGRARKAAHHRQDDRITT